MSSCADFEFRVVTQVVQTVLTSNSGSPSGFQEVVAGNISKVEKGSFHCPYLRYHLLLKHEHF